MNRRKRLYIDIEVSPNIGTFWQSGYNIRVTYENIIKERAVICVAYKWEGSDKIKCLTWDKDQCDKELLQKIVPIMESADEIIAHNGDNFDIKWLRTRCLFHRIPCSPFLTTIDTLKEAKKLFKFNSNRLDYISKFLNHGGKMETGYGLWTKVVLDKNKKALAEMVEYCKMDVLQLERVWDEFNKYVKPKTSIAEYRHECPECGSDDMYVKDRVVSAAGVVKVRIKCKSCEKHHTVPAKTFEAHKKLKKINTK
jgi:DNA polymerase elongation subunit (family B)